MSLFPKWSGKLTLPELELQNISIGGNLVKQIAFVETLTNGEIHDISTFPGHDLLKTELPYPFGEILIRKRRAKKLDKPKYPVIIIGQDDQSYSSLDESTLIKWEDSRAITQSRKVQPEAILEGWRGKFNFRQEDPIKNEDGLRPPQIGALHSLIAHFIVGENHEPATIVLPTGTGKTETMISSLFHNRLEKLLVIVPSKVLRQQLFLKFCSLGILPLMEVVPFNSDKPVVCKIQKGLKSEDDTRKLVEKANVIIATPNILRTSKESCRKILYGACSDLFIDEAHHSSAATWSMVREKFKGKRITQFTATPFRTDGKHIGGDIIFNYKLGDAQKAGYFKPIRLATIEEWGETSLKDEAIAREAIRILKSDIEENSLDHLMMARVDKIPRAKYLLSLYNKIAPEYKPIAVYSGKGMSLKNREALKALTTRKSRIVICVDMLGEGFDMPNLKVVAIHDGHKSLAVTLQFIGRFTRKSKGVGEAAAVINIADSKAEKNIQQLYSDGANWDELLKRFSESRIDREKKLQDIVNSLKSKGSLHNQISLWNLTPSYTTQVYRTDFENWYPENYSKVLPKNFQTWSSISEEKKILVVLGIHENPVKWGSHQNLKDIYHELLIIHWNEEEKVLFAYSNDYDAFRIEKLVGSITYNKVELLKGPKIFNILNNVELPLVKNLGASRVGAISFTSYFGPNVTDGLALIEKNESELNNIACVGYEDGDRVIWGGTQKKGKIWAVQNGTIYDWIEWCDKTWKKVSDESLEEPNIIRDFLKPVKITTNYVGTAIAVQWGEHVQSKDNDKVGIIFDTEEIPLYLVDIGVNSVNSSQPIEIKISSETQESIYLFTIDSSAKGGYKYELISGKPVYFRYGRGQKRSFDDHILSDPFIIYYHDGTYSYNNYHIPTKLNIGEFPKNQIETWDWNGIALNHESMGKEMSSNSIQYRTFKMIEDEYDFIFNDDDSGEAADLVALRDINETTIGLTLVHCKNAKGGVPSGQIENLYTVCGQAQKSIRVKHAGIPRLANDLRRRHEKWSKSGYTRFLKGDFKKLAYFQDKSRKCKINFEVIIVQPGLKKSSASKEILKLLGTTQLYLHKTAKGDFRVIAHE